MNKSCKTIKSDSDWSSIFSEWAGTLRYPLARLVFDGDTGAGVGDLSPRFCVQILQNSNSKVDNYIKSLNWGAKTDLRSKAVKWPGDSSFQNEFDLVRQLVPRYYNAFATFKDPHTISLDNGKGKVEEVRTWRVLCVTMKSLFSDFLISFPSWNFVHLRHRLLPNTFS